MKAKVEGNSCYNKEITAERLCNLRMELESELGKQLSALQLVEMIHEKTGIKFGGNTYNKHENFANESTMSIELLIALSKFYGVSHDYILGFSNSKYPEREDTQTKYGLSDDALNKLANITQLHEMQEAKDAGLPTDMDIINALFESGEFQSLIELIRKAVIFRQRAGQTNYYESKKKCDKLIQSLDDEQTELTKEGALTVLTANDALEYINFQLQQTTLNLVKDVMNEL